MSAPPNETREQLLHRFAARLEEIRLAAGMPSYGTLSQLGERHLPKSTISDVLRAKSAPSDSFVRHFLRACKTHARRNGWPVDDAVFDEKSLFDAWRELHRRLGALRRETRWASRDQVPDQAEQLSPGGQVNGLPAGTVDLGLLGRVLAGLRRNQSA